MKKLNHQQPLLQYLVSYDPSKKISSLLLMLKTVVLLNIFVCDFVCDYWMNRKFKITFHLFEKK